MYMYICICICTYIYVHLHIHTCIPMHAHLCMRACVYILIYMCTDRSLCIHTCILSVPVSTYTTHATLHIVKTVVDDQSGQLTVPMRIRLGER